MGVFNRITGTVFDLLVAPWGHGWPLIDITLWSVFAGILALLVYKKMSSQAGIVRAKECIKMHLLEVRLWREEPSIVGSAFLRILARNVQYLGFNLVPMVVLTVPMMALLFQLVANFAFVPTETGGTTMLEVRMDASARNRVYDLELELPEGVRQAAPPVRTADGRAFWRLRAELAGDHTLKLRLGEQTLSKGWAVGGAARKVPVLRTKTWEALLFPGEALVPAAVPVERVTVAYARRAMPLTPPGELGVSAWFLLISLAAGFALKDVMGVSI